jgi:ArsR family transcriptional regulator
MGNSMASTIKSLKALSDPTRVRLLNLLDAAELTVAELQEILAMGQSRISTHLALLKSAGLVRDRRSGKNIYYGAADGAGVDEGLRDFAKAASRELEESDEDRIALKLLLEKRSDTAREYFDKLAGKFGKSYCPGRSWESLAQMFLDLLPKLTIADLGAGEGTLSIFLARRAKKVIAIDSSEKMVEFGTQLAKTHGYANVEYRQGDMEDPPIRKGSVDLVIFSQALHHARRPEKAVAAAAELLKPSGRLVVLDLLAHTFEPARELYADVWLGFKEVDLYRMLEQAGLKDISVRVVARETDAPRLETILASGVLPD